MQNKNSMHTYNGRFSFIIIKYLYAISWQVPEKAGELASLAEISVAYSYRLAATFALILFIRFKFFKIFAV